MASKVVSIPELLSAILDVADRRTLGQCVQASRMWSELSLDPLWKDLPSLFPLMNLLGLHVQSTPYPPPYDILNGLVTFVVIDQTPSETQWERWFVYARRVKTLVHCDPDNPENRHAAGPMLNHDSDQNRAINEESFSYLAGKKDLLPSLVELRWKTRAEPVPNLLHLLPFIGKSLKFLSLPWFRFALDVSGPRVVDFLTSLNQWPGTLEEIELGSIIVHPRIHTVQLLIHDLLVKQKSLRRLSLTAFAFPLLLDAVNETVHPTSLMELEILVGNFPPGPSVAPVPSIQPLFTFQGLIQAVIWARLPRLLQDDVFRMAKGWPRMKRLFLTATEGNLSLLLDFASSIPALEFLGFEVVWSTPAERPNTEPRAASLLGHLRALYVGSCRGLTSQVDQDAAARLIAVVCPINCSLMPGWRGEKDNLSMLRVDKIATFDSIKQKVQAIQGQQWRSYNSEESVRSLTSSRSTNRGSRPPAQGNKQQRQRTPSSATTPIGIGLV